MSSPTTQAGTRAMPTWCSTAVHRVGAVHAECARHLDHLAALVGVEHPAVALREPGVDHAVVLQQVGRMARLATRGEVARRGDDQVLDDADRSRHQRAGRQIADAHRQLDPFLDQVHRLVGQPHVQTHPRVRGEKLRDHRHDDRSTVRIGQGDAQQPARLGARTADRRVDRGSRIEQVLHPLVQARRLVGRVQLAGGAGEQLHLQLRLERGDVLADGRLRQPELAPRGRKAAELVGARERGITH
jgi:hypothetical protein